MLSINEILTNKKKVSFSYGEDTVTILYRPFVFKKKNEYKWVQRVLGWVKSDTQNNLKKQLIRWAQRYILKKAIIEWDFTENGKPLSISRGLRIFPDFFLQQLYWSLVAEIVITSKQAMNEALKKK